MVLPRWPDRVGFTGWNFSCMRGNTQNPHRAYFSHRTLDVREMSGGCHRSVGGPLFYHAFILSVTEGGANGSVVPIARYRREARLNQTNAASRAKGPLSGGPAREAWKDFRYWLRNEGMALDKVGGTAWMELNCWRVASVLA